MASITGNRQQTIKININRYGNADATTINVGRVGDHNHTILEINVSNWISDYSNGISFDLLINKNVTRTALADIAIINNMGKFTIYVDNVAKATATIDNLDSVTETLLIGAQHDSNGEPFRFGTMTIPIFKFYSGVIKESNLSAEFTNN